VTGLSEVPAREGVTVSRRTRRVLPLALPLLLGLALTSCGDDGDGGSDSGSGSLSSVEITGEVGSDPEVKWGGDFSVDEITSEVIVEGDGEKIETGDSVLVDYWLGNAFTEEQVYSTHPTSAQLLVAESGTLSPVFLEAVEGQTIGSRVAVAAPAEEIFGPEGNPELKVGNQDTVVAVVDLLSKGTDGPDGAEKPAPAWAPKIVEKDGVPTSLDFTGTPKPGPQTRSATLIQGTGATVEKGQTIAVNYLGQVYGGKKPFDESYSKGQPAAFSIGTGSVVPGWDKTLVGVKVGSRVMLSIPPKDGYGEQGNAQAGIKGTDTLFFVVDVLAAG
jgi:peptidylprolyl isomerase